MAGLAFILFVLPLSGVIILMWLLTQRKEYGVALILLWLGSFLLLVLSYAARPLFEKKILDESDYYGTYVIDRDYFSGPEADWQYDSFRFEIKENDSIYFHVTDGERIIKTYTGTVYFTEPYKSKRLGIKMKEPAHHVVSSHPTVYRDVWDFFLVFRSTKYHNMYFRKGNWKPFD